MAILASALCDDSATGGSQSATKSRAGKRTNTGCLTCRKRRIKCGEEKPTCNNCTKSKRQCDGYNQTVNSKPTIGDWPNDPGVVSSIQYHTSMLPEARNQSYREPEPTTGMQEGMHRPSQPSPHCSYDSQHAWPSESHAGGIPSYTLDQACQLPLLSSLHQRPLHSPNHPELNHTQTASAFSRPPSNYAYPHIERKHDPYTIY